MIYIFPLLIVLTLFNIFGGKIALVVNMFLITLFSWITNFEIINMIENIILAAALLVMLIIITFMINLKNKKLQSLNLENRNFTILGLAAGVFTGAVINTLLGTMIGFMFSVYGTGKIYIKKGLSGILQYYSVLIVQIINSLIFALVLLYFYIN